MTDDGRTVTEIRLRDDTQPSDFRVPLPATAAAIENGCSCPAQPEWPTIAIASDCAQRPVDGCGIAASFSCAVTIAIRPHLGITSKRGQQANIKPPITQQVARRHGMGFSSDEALRRVRGGDRVVVVACPQAPKPKGAPATGPRSKRPGHIISFLGL